MVFGVPTGVVFLACAAVATFAAMLFVSLASVQIACVATYFLFGPEGSLPRDLKETGACTITTYRVRDAGAYTSPSVAEHAPPFFDLPHVNPWSTALAAFKSWLVTGFVVGSLATGATAATAVSPILIHPATPAALLVLATYFTFAACLSAYLPASIPRALTVALISFAICGLPLGAIATGLFIAMFGPRPFLPILFSS